MPTMRIKTLTVFACLMMALLMPNGWAIEMGAPLPALKLEDTAGKIHELSQAKDQLLIINFWATWCVPCIQEIPDFNKLYNKYKDKSVVIWGIGADVESPKDVAKFLKKTAIKSIDYPVLKGDFKLLRKFSVQGLPTTLIIKPDGTLAAIEVGPRTLSQMEETIKPFLPKPSKDTPKKKG